MGVGVTGFVRHGISEEVNLLLGVLYSYHLPAPANDTLEDDAPGAIQVIIPHAGVTIALDIIDLVPYISLSGTVYLSDEAFFEEDRSMGFGLMAGAGLDYRRWRDISLGVELGYHAFLSDMDKYPVYVTLAVHATWHSDVF